MRRIARQQEARPPRISRPYMRIAYGTQREKHLFGSAFLVASICSGLLLLWQGMFRFPYLWVTLYVAFCGLVTVLFPLRGLGRTGPLRILYRAIPAMLFMGAIFLASSLSIPPEGGGLTVSDVYLHTAEFSILGLLAARMVHPTRTPPLRLRHLPLAMAVVAGYGCLDEIHQRFVPGRNPSVRDLFWDILGGAGGILVYALFLRRFVSAIDDEEDS